MRGSFQTRPSLCMVMMVFLVDIMDYETLGSSIPGAVLLRAQGHGFLDLTMPLQLKGYVTPPCDLIEPAFTCPEGERWSAHIDEEGAVCLWMDNSHKTFYDANATCAELGASLFTIRSEYRQHTINDVLAKIEEPVWAGVLGTHRPRTEGHNQNLLEEDYANQGDPSVLEDEDNPYCVYMNDRSFGTMDLPECSVAEHLFLCERPAECARQSVFGERCDKENRCYGKAHFQGTRPCPYGCQKGWMGPQCCARKEMAEVAYYCMNSAERGLYLMLRVDPRGVSYDSMTAVDEAGQPLPWCEGLEVLRSDEGLYTIKIPVAEDTKSMKGPTPCAGNKTDNTTFEWTISLEEKAGLRLPLDRTLHLSCDFDTALGTSLAYSSVVDAGNRPAVEEPTESREQVELDIIDPYTGKNIIQGIMGTSVELCLRINMSDAGLGAQGVSPYNCQVRSRDGSIQRNLTDEHGCPLSRSPISKLKKAEGGVCTSPFELFAFPGHRDIIFTCAIDFCFEADDPVCDDRCGSWQSPNATKRTRRDVGEQASYVKTAFQTVSGQP